VIEREPNEQGYRLQIAGLESTVVRRADCSELAEFAIYAVEASDLPPPECTRTSVSVGVSATPLLNFENGDALIATQVRLTIPIARAELTPFGFWLPQTQVQNQVPRDGRALNPDWESLSLGGYGAGLDACWPLVNGLLGRDDLLHVCGTGVWRRFRATPTTSNASAEAELWTVGGSISWRVGLFDSVHLELAPTVLVGLGNAATYASGTRDRLYQYSGVEAQMRIGIVWDFLVRHTRVQPEPFRTARTSFSKSTLATASTNGLERF
jgi:hypothetical protein